jgi:hypothetical protein
MKTISDVELALVTGGKGPDATTVSPSSGGTSSNNDAVLSALQGIQSSINDLGTKQGLFSGNNGLLFMTMALAMSRRSEVVVYGGGGWHHRGYGFRAYW